jgi:hypothetical protein
MPLVCRNCHSINQDPGGDPRLYRCGACQHQELERVQGYVSEKTVGGTIAGAAIGGMIFGPFGALVGAVIGAALGEKAK